VKDRLHTEGTSKGGGVQGKEGGKKVPASTVSGAVKNRSHQTREGGKRGSCGTRGDTGSDFPESEKRCPNYETTGVGVRFLNYI